MNAKKKIVILAAISLLLILSIYIPVSIYPLNKAIIYILEKRLEAKIACRSLKVYIWRSLVAEGIEAMGKGGFGLSAEKVVLDYNLISLITKRLHVSCDLSNVKFYKSSSIINSLSDILHIQPLGNLTFKTIKADFFVGKEDTLTRDLALLSDQVKIFGNAVTGKDNSIMCLLYFFLKDDITREIPEEIQELLLQKEEGPWSSVYIGVMGNYRKPTLRIITESFRMNISSD